MSDAQSLDKRTAALRERLTLLAHETDACVQEFTELSELAKVLGMAEATLDGRLSPEDPHKFALEDAEFSLYGHPKRESIWACFDILWWITARAGEPSTGQPAEPFE